MNNQYRYIMQYKKVTQKTISFVIQDAKVKYCSQLSNYYYEY